MQADSSTQKAAASISVVLMIFHVAYHLRWSRSDAKRSSAIPTDHPTLTCPSRARFPKGRDVPTDRSHQAWAVRSAWFVSIASAAVDDHAVCDDRRSKQKMRSANTS